MTYEEALKFEKTALSFHKVQKQHLLVELKRVIIRAIEKQIRKKPIGVYCPVCKNDCDTDVDTPFPNYCPNCGQALDWSSKNDSN